MFIPEFFIEKFSNEIEKYYSGLWRKMKFILYLSIKVPRIKINILWLSMKYLTQY